MITVLDPQLVGAAVHTCPRRHFTPQRFQPVQFSGGGMTEIQQMTGQALSVGR